jgi:hypothetical protein
VNAENTRTDEALDLRCGELVEVRSEGEILATLDANGELDGLSFMPEMLRFCGSRLRVFRRADKTCDTITGQNLGRRMRRCVHLEGARCDGSGHGGCQAACLIFWNEAWLKRVEPRRGALLWRLVVGSGPRSAARAASCTIGALQTLTVREDPASSADPTYRCQATRLIAATSPLAWWEPGQYLRDWLSGNVSLVFLLRAMLFRVLSRLVRMGRGYRLKRTLYNGLARLFGEVPWPYDGGTLSGRTPREFLHLQPGELVEVKSLAEIRATLNGRMNRGLSFAPEMARYCGGTYRVRARAEKIIDEKSGRMIRLDNDCIILEDVICQSECSSHRLFCPRSIFPYWREIWLRRVAEGPDSREAATRGGSTSR